MASEDAREKGGSLKVLMDEVQLLNREAAALAMDDGLPALVEYRWRPGAADVPAVYNILGDSPLVQKDQLLHSDNITLYTRIAVAYGDDASEMGLLEAYIDIFRHVWDRALMGAGLGNAPASRRPFNGAAVWANRTGMRGVPEEFNSIPYAAIEMTTNIRLDRTIV